LVTGPRREDLVVTLTRSNSDLQTALEETEAEYRAARPASAARHAAAARHMPGGNTRTVIFYSPFPLTWAGGRGNRLTDLDGREYLDLLGDYSAGLYGHSEPAIQAALKTAIDDGTSLGGPNRYEDQLAAAIRVRFPSLDLIRFTNSGTEANLLALSAARAQRPGRTRAMVFNHAYHGAVFSFTGGGSALTAPFSWVLGDYNDTDGTRRLLQEAGDELFAVLVEPMLGAGGCIPGTPEFLGMLREECAARRIVLIFDEVMTSRLSPGGLHGRLGLKPDLTTFGKYLGGGASFGAFGGTRELMERFDPTHPQTIAHPGTFNNNVLSMAGGLAGLMHVLTLAAVERLDGLGDRFRQRIDTGAHERNVPLRTSGVGSLLNLHFAHRPITRPADAHPVDPAAAEVLAGLQKLLHLDMLMRGFYFARRGLLALSLPTTDADLECFITALDDFLETHGALVRRMVPPDR
jgi:glutamate-1-semialdehyde 2,1-aminomutase